MTNDQVSAWLDDLGLGKYRETFKQNAIDWDVLPDLSDGDLEALGVLLGHRKKLLRYRFAVPECRTYGPGLYTHFCRSRQAAIPPRTRSSRTSPADCDVL
jgi:hypothetical protein